MTARDDFNRIVRGRWGGRAPVILETLERLVPDLELHAISRVPYKRSFKLKMRLTPQPIMMMAEISENALDDALEPLDVFAHAFEDAGARAKRFLLEREIDRCGDRMLVKVLEKAIAEPTHRHEEPEEMRMERLGMELVQLGERLLARAHDGERRVAGREPRYEPTQATQLAQDERAAAILARAK